MSILPIVERELRVASRHRGTWWVRFGAALVALIVGGWIMLIPGMNSPRTLGLALFVSLAVVIFLYALFSGIRTTTDCLSEEKREGTLGLLFLTDLKGHDIIFGKLAATSINAFYGLLAVLPVLAIPLLLGGVAIGEFWRVSLCALNIMIFSLSVGMFCSAISRDEVKSMLAALVLNIFFAGGLPLIGGIVSAAHSGRTGLFPLFFIPSPGYAAFASFDMSYRQLSAVGFNYFEWSMAVIFGMSCLLLGLSCVIVPRTWQVKADSAEKVRVKTTYNGLKFGGKRARKAMRTRMLEINPVHWLTGRDRIKPTLLWIVMGAGALLWIYGLVEHPRDWKDEVAYIWTAFFLYAILTVWIATESCRQFALDRRSGALELILSTPLTISQILWGQIRSMRRQFLGPVLVTLVVFAVFLATDTDEGLWVLFWLCVIAGFLIDSWALLCLGMWSGLTSGNIGRSSSKGVLMILVLPWVAWGALMTFLALTGFFDSRIVRSGSDLIPAFIMLSRLGMTVLFAGGCGLHSWSSLNTKFRHIATQSFAARKSKFSRKKEGRPPVTPPLPATQGK